MISLLTQSVISFNKRKYAPNNGGWVARGSGGAEKLTNNRLNSAAWGCWFDWQTVCQTQNDFGVFPVFIVSEGKAGSYRFFLILYFRLEQTLYNLHVCTIIPCRFQNIQNIGWANTFWRGEISPSFHTMCSAENSCVWGVESKLAARLRGGAVSRFFNASMAEFFFLARNSHRHNKARRQQAETQEVWQAIVEHITHFT